MIGNNGTSPVISYLLTELQLMACGTTRATTTAEIRECAVFWNFSLPEHRQHDSRADHAVAVLLKGAVRHLLTALHGQLDVDRGEHAAPRRSIL